MKVKPVFLRAPFNYDVDAASDESGLRCEDVSLAKQSFKDECDINTIVRNFGLTGELPNDVRAPQYGDFEGVFDYHTAMNQVIAAQDSFMQMPAEVRARFNNDPGAFVDFCSDVNNLEEMEKLGLVVSRKEEKPAEPAASTVST